MPLHRIFVPPNLYSDADKAAMAEAITSCYPMLPKFYVVVLFIEVNQGNYFVGGKSTQKFVRIAVEHIARAFPDNVSKRKFMDYYERAIQPWTSGKGVDWEVQIEECDRLLWNENGMNPPLPGSEGEKIWKEQDKAVNLSAKL